MIKHYKANTAISVNVVLQSKKSMHVTFASHSDGSSTYVTDNEEVQNALEHHYKFGRLFKLTKGVEAVPAVRRKGTGMQKEPPGIRKIKVSDLSAAKEYLADTYGVCRTSMRSMKSILEAAKAHNIEFEGL